MRSFVLPTFVVLSSLSQTLAAASCDCYETSTGDYFTTHEFLDFRSGKKPSNFDEFFTILSVDTYKGNTVNNAMVSSNVGFDGGQMSLVTKNDGSGTQQSADMYSKPSMLHGSFRIHAQVTGAAGAVAGFFTFLDATDEQDLEILTNEAHDQIHYTNHNNDGAAGGDTNGGNPTINTTISSPWTNYNTYRLDWIPTKTSFYANEDPVKELTSAVPTKPCTLNVNMWSSGDGWGGAMAVGESATFNVQWIEAVYNVSAASSRIKRYASHGAPHHAVERRQSGVCTNVCKVDGVATLGTPEPVGAGGVSGPSGAAASPPSSLTSPVISPAASNAVGSTTTAPGDTAVAPTATTLAKLPSVSGIHGAPPSLHEKKADEQDDCDVD